MTILIACERSGMIRRAFRARGHDAWSCDLSPADDVSPFHHKGDCVAFIERGAWDQCAQKFFPWDLMIAHPPCTFLTNSAAWAFADPDFERFPGVGYHQKIKADTLTGSARREAREAASAFALALWHAPIARICIENPIGHLSRVIPGKPQIVQPYNFGDDASKATCLWLKGLPPLRGTHYAQPRIVNGRARWANQTDSGQNRLSPTEDRATRRSETYPGIAEAMADQWGKIFQ